MGISRRIQSVFAPTHCARPAPAQVPARGMKELDREYNFDHGSGKRASTDSFGTGGPAIQAGKRRRANSPVAVKEASWKAY
jgi:hypothetical protein